MRYKCGDSLAIFPRNDTDGALEILDSLAIGPHEPVKVATSAETSILSALVENFSITVLPQQFFAWFCDSVADRESEQELRGMMLRDGDGRRAMVESLSLLKILRRFKVGKVVKAQELVDRLRRLTPRLYSIASSPLINNDEVHIAVRVVDYVDAAGNRKHGFASTYLAEGLAVGSDTARTFIVNSPFALPSAADARILMVGPGTGIAPFRGFLQERWALKNSGKAIGESWLFFGDRHHASDFLFRDEIVDFQNAGVLTKLHTAFSRDQARKVYVQDRIWENRDEVWQWIAGGAHLYVCGNASSMATDVENVLRKIFVEVGNVPEASLDGYFGDLKAARRYQKEVY
jgi:sulfite reductase (NADPH) flavoprotein alpha-component